MKRWKKLLKDKNGNAFLGGALVLILLFSLLNFFLYDATAITIVEEDIPDIPEDDDSFRIPFFSDLADAGGVVLDMIKGFFGAIGQCLALDFAFFKPLGVIGVMIKSIIWICLIIGIIMILPFT